MCDASSSKRLDSIELHDAKIESFSLRPGGALEISFTHLAVYFETGPLLYKIRSYEASLLLEGVRRFELDGALGGDWRSTITTSRNSTEQLAEPPLTGILLEPAAPLELSTHYSTFPTVSATDEFFNDSGPGAN